MKIVCVKEKIKNAVGIAEKITGRNLTLPVLGTVLVIAKGNVLKIRATNLDLGIEIVIPAKIEQEGIVAVPGNIFSNLLSNIYHDTILLESKNENLFVSTNNSSTLLKTYSYDDFPTLPSISASKSFTIPVENLILGLKSVWYSAAVSDIKPEIASINVYTEGENIFFVATDSFRLAEKKVKVSNKGNVLSLLIPLKNVAEIIRAFDGFSGEMKINFNDNQISFKYDGIYITSRLVEGIFPDYKQIFPKGFTTEAVLLKQDLINALRVTNLFANKFNQINVKINPRSKIFELHSENADVGENVIKLDAALSGEPVGLNFNHKYILDCFQSIAKDSISLQFNGDGKPMVIQGVGEKTFTYLVMPLNQ